MFKFFNSNFGSLFLGAIFGFILSFGMVKYSEASGTFQIGPQLGYSALETSPTHTGASLGDFDLNGLALGAVARYTLPVGVSGASSSDGMFIGVQAGIMKEYLENKGSFTSTATASDGTESTATATSDISTIWSADLMPRVGYRIGDISLSLATGLSFIQGQVKAVGNIANTAVTSSDDTQWHMGVKIAPGIDYELTNGITLFSQAHYAIYESKNYTKSGASIKSKPIEYGLRAGVLFGF